MRILATLSATNIILAFCVHIFTSSYVEIGAVASLSATKVGGEGESSSKFIRNFYKSGGFLKKGITSILSVDNLSENCSRDVSRFGKQILAFLEGRTDNDTKIDRWALQMLDATGKVPEGVLSGHVNALGDFDECLAIRAPAKQVESSTGQFQGKYCLLYVMPNFRSNPESYLQSGPRIISGERSLENLMKILNITVQAELPVIPSYGSCLPSTCSDQEIFQIVSAVMTNLKFTPQVVASFCSVDEGFKIGTGAIITLSILGALASVILTATFTDLAIRHDYLKRSLIDSKLYGILHCFSMRSNMKDLLSTKTNDKDISCLYGLRFIGASWVVLCHSYLCGTQMQPVHNFVDVYSMLTSGPLSAILVNGAIVVDIFLVIGGFLVSLSLLTALEKTGGKLNIPLIYINRYLRITPLYGVIILMGTFIFPLLGSGPYWHVAKTWAGFCERNWWKNLLYVNNLPIYNTLQDPLDAPCHGIAWYLGVDMQLFLVSPFLLYPIWKWKVLGSAPLLLVTVWSIVFPGLLTYLEGYMPFSVPFGNIQNRFSQLSYTPTYMRATPYFIGMCVGLLFHSTKQSKALTFKKPLILTIWMTTIIVCFAVIFSPQKFLDPQYNFKRDESAIYVTGHRTAWALAVSWLIFACGSGYGGWINQFLSWKPFIPLGRLTFAIYLVSLHLQFLFHLQYRQPVYFSNYEIMNLFFAHLTMSILIGFLCVMLIEAPAMNLLKMLIPSTCDRSNKGQSRNEIKGITESKTELVTDDNANEVKNKILNMWLIGYQQKNL